MSTGLNKIVAAGLAAVTLMGSVTLGSTPASARWHHRYGYYYPYRHYGYYYPYRHYGYYYRRHHYGYGAAPFFGALVGSLAAGALVAPYYYGPRYYYGPPPYYYGPGPYYGW